jgi:hypothetical protein
VAPIYALCRFITHAFQIGDHPRQVMKRSDHFSDETEASHVDHPPHSASILVMTSLALPARIASAHPSSGIVVDQQGQAAQVIQEMGQV